MTSPAPAPQAPKQSGLSFVEPAPETLVFPAELDQRASQVTAGRVLRVIDSFVFLTSGSKAPLPLDWYKTQKWDNVVVIGAVASIDGNDALLAQSGRFDKIFWRWVILRHVSSAMISSDSRFRKGEPCLWLITKVAKYAILQPHKGYVTDWDRSTAGIRGYDAVPQPRRCKPRDPMPAWWDVERSDLWLEGVGGTKRAAVDPPPAANDEGDATAVGRASPAAESSNRTTLAKDHSTANVLLELAHCSWDITKDLVPEKRQDTAPAHVQEPAERETKRPRFD